MAELLKKNVRKLHNLLHPVVLWLWIEREREREREMKSEKREYNAMIMYTPSGLCILQKSHQNSRKNDAQCNIKYHLLHVKKHDTTMCTL